MYMNNALSVVSAAGGGQSLVKGQNKTIMSLLSFLVSARAPPVIELAGRSRGHNVDLDSIHLDVCRSRLCSFRLAVQPNRVFKSSRSPRPESATVAQLKATEFLNQFRDNVTGILQQQASEDELEKLANIICSAAGMNSETGDPIIIASLESYGETLTNTILRRARDYRDNTSSLRQGPETLSHLRASSPSIRAAPQVRAPASTSVRVTTSPTTSRVTTSTLSVRATPLLTTINNLDVSTVTKTFNNLAGSGSFTYHSSQSNDKITSPPSLLSDQFPPVMGDLYIHLNKGPPERRLVWYYNGRNQWEDISELWGETNKMLVHPTIPERILTVHRDHSPNWILRSSMKPKKSGASK
ncbi:hypothetical protein B0H11DRAFT_1932550 [Mycena galericulata]|nr:hypothetical protein B0H11DRAFT_1932550 [Mycena galericulata]